MLLGQNQGFITFTNTRDNRDVDQPEGIGKNTIIRVVEVDFCKPHLGIDLELFWNPARKVITRKLLNCM